MVHAHFVTIVPGLATVLAKTIIPSEAEPSLYRFSAWCMDTFFSANECHRILQGSVSHQPLICKTTYHFAHNTLCISWKLDSTFLHFAWRHGLSLQSKAVLQHYSHVDGAKNSRFSLCVIHLHASWNVLIMRPGWWWFPSISPILSCCNTWCTRMFCHSLLSKASMEPVVHCPLTHEADWNIMPARTWCNRS